MTTWGANIELFVSNLLNVFAALVAAAFTYPVARHSLVYLLAFAVMVLVVFSALLDVGEVYSYSDYYKLVYWLFWDDLIIWLGPLFSLQC